MIRINPQKVILILVSVLVVCSIFIAAASAVFLSTSEDILIEPIGIGDIPSGGREILPKVIEGSEILADWQHQLTVSVLQYFGLFEDTPLGDYTRKHIYPISFVIFSLLSSVVLYTRFKPREKKFNCTALKIYDYIKSHPMCSMNMIIEELGCSRGSASYQIRKLEKASNVFKVKISNVTYYSVKYINSYSLQMMIEHVIRNESIGEVLKILKDEPGLTRYEIAARIDKCPNTVSYYLKSLDRNIVNTVIQSDGNYVYSLTDDAVQIVNSIA
ncbi:MAG: hypothetical protein Q4Q53_06775 [Methanocorpusculum sp.]|nr:hypothetical protein [Methanocorpusculum sp.]